MNRKPEHILEEATNLCQEEQELEAEVLVKDALIKDPNNLDLLTKLGVIQARLCKDEEAEFTFKSVLEKDPDYEEALCGLGRLLDQSLRAEEAEILYRDYLARNRSSHCVIDDLCRLLLTEERGEEALKLARDHVTLFHSDVEAYAALRYTLVMLEDKLGGELDNNRESVSVTTSLLGNLLDQLSLINQMKQGAVLTPTLERELLDETSRVAGEIEHVLTSARIRNMPIPEEIVTRVDTLLKL